MNQQQVLEKLETIFKEYKDDLEPGSLKPETSFEELDLDSLDVVDMMMACEDAFGVEIPDDAELKTVQDLLQLLMKAEDKA